MISVGLQDGADLAGFRRAVRGLVARGVRPEAVSWSIGAAPDLFAADPLPDAPPVPLPRKVAQRIETVVCHGDPERYALLYTLVWRVLSGEHELLGVPSDPLVHRLEMMAKAIRRDLHKMHAFLRFRRLDGEPERFVAWFEPEHYIVEATASFFVDRFRGLDWSILTPVGSLHWDGDTLAVGPPAQARDAPGGDALDDAWRAYYESIFNPARTNPTMMRTEMPKKYWRNLPEARTISALIRSAPARVTEMIEREAAMPIKRNPDKAVTAMSDQAPTTLAELNRIIAAAEPLVPGATRAVLGEGPAGAAIAFVGEQPGDQEDLEGRPFVGPAGQILNRALAEAGIDRARTYVTNAVKHFKFELRGKRRLHQKPTPGEVKHYRWWLIKELELVRPRLIVALGATALLALSGRAMSVMRSRGATEFDGWRGYVTVHPSYLLRLPDEEAKARAYAEFVADLKAIGSMTAARSDEPAHAAE